MNNNNKKYFGLLIVPLIGVIFSAYQLARISWNSTSKVQAAITSGTETHSNFLTPTTMNRAKSAIDDAGNTIIVWSMADPFAADTNGQGVYYRRFDKTGTALDAGDILVNTSTTGDQQNPDVAMDRDGNFIIVWEGAGDQTGEEDTNGVFLQAFQADGTPIGGESRANINTTATAELSPVVTVDYDGPNNATRFMVGWSQYSASLDYGNYIQRYDVDFTQTATGPSRIGGPIDYFPTTDIETLEGLAINSLGEFALVWSQDDGAGTINFYYSIWTQDQSTLLGKTLLNTETSGATPDVAADKMPRSSLDDTNSRSFIFTYGDSSNNLYVIRQNCSDPDPGNGTNIDVTCSQSGSKLIANDATAAFSNPSISADYLGNFTVAWEETGSDGNGTGIVSQSFNYQGKRINQNINVNTTTTGNQTSPDIAMNTDGFYTIIFEDESNNDNLFQNFITEIFKTENETSTTPISTQTGTNVDAAVAPNGNLAFVYRTTGTVPAEAVRFTLKRYDSSASPSYIDVKTAEIISASSGADNPSVSFFKDTSGSSVGNFIVTWEDNSSGTKNIYYQLFDEAGDPIGSATAVNASANGQQNAHVVAGVYTNSGGSDIEEFAVIWHDFTAQSIESAYHNTSMTYNQLYSGCTDCVAGGVDMDPDTTDIVYTWEDSIAGTREVLIRQATGGSLVGSNAQVPLAGSENVDPDIAFVSGGRYVVTFTSLSGADSDVFAKLYAFNAGGPVSGGLHYSLTQYSQAEARDFATAIAADTNSNQFLVVWGDSPATAEDMIFGQFLQFTGGGTYGFEPFGPTFRINSTINSGQILPSADINQRGQTAVAWEGNFESTGGNDSSTAIYQLLQSPLVLLGVDKFEPVAQQEVQAGGQFLDVPTNVTFPSVPVDITQNTVQEVSVRDAIYGGDVKYVEIQDATGVDFTLTIQADDFFAAADGKAYIKNDEHFRVKNWDNDLTNIDAGDCDDTNTPTDADLCFQTVESTNTPTAFTLNPATQSYTFIDTQKVLAEKTGTTNNEIGRWRIFPEFEITVPPFIAPGTHSAEITFTLT
ncbi:MAG: hypothetical protein R3B71_03580 [Candidatus Gracilibacteria bacterium]